MVAKRKLSEIEMLRGLSIMGVVAVHVFNAGLLYFPTDTDEYKIFFYLVKIFICSVSVFLLISGMMASYTNKDKPLKVGQYYRKKVLRVVLPYMIWTVLFVLFQVYNGSVEPEKLTNASSWFYWIFLGKGYYHLYFMTLIIQFYIIVPLLLPLAKLVKNKPVVAFLIAAVPQIAIYWANVFWIYSKSPYFISSVFGYYCIVFAGMWLGLNYEKLCNNLKKYFVFSLFGLGISGAIYFYYVEMMLQKIEFGTFLYTVNWQFVVLFASLVLFGICRFFAKSEKNPIAKVLLWIGTCSFGIYLIHPAITYFTVPLLEGQDLEGMIIGCSLMVIGLIVVCGVPVYFLQKWTPTALLFGIVKRK